MNAFFTRMHVVREHLTFFACELINFDEQKKPANVGKNWMVMMAEVPMM